MPHPHHHFHHHHPHGPRGERFGDEGGPGRGGRPERGHGGPGRGGPRGHGPDAERHRAHKRERMFEAGGLKLLTLHLIGQQPSHGYDVIRAIGELVGGDYQPSPGTIYPTLSYLVDMGHATATDSDGGRKQYRITPEGQQALAEQADMLQLILARLAAGKDREARQRPATLVRALENFKMALRLKLDTSELSDEQVAQIAALLDETALKIEKI